MEILESKYYKTRSDGVRIFVVDPENGCQIRNVDTGQLYSPPTYDVEGSGNRYVATDIPIETPTQPESHRIEALEAVVAQQAEDIEANAEAIQELGELIGGDE